MNKTWFKWARKCHKWLGYILALQVFAWLLGGLVMSAIPLEYVHGKHLAKRQLENPFSQDVYTTDFNLFKEHDIALKKVNFTHFLNTPVIELIGEESHVYLHGETGKLFTPPNQQQIITQAKAHYLGDASQIEVIATKLKEGPREVGYKTNIWRVDFADNVNTTLYIQVDSGQVITVRSTIWRIFDFFWMLHIMDYDEREDFNNPLLISFAAVAVLFCISGMILLFQNMPLRRKRRALAN
ncbi:hypothetical protein [Pseudoalteromonas sp. G4]|uniref:hypothetical protein n=1 Tax=Pseudoalteromonas sp. G4 TaxID=2992761 RepID=UPI00237EB619|nr:hypothetical protein [Pseudoalteromonas sp. G4]MDE3273678.1 hypothetical protein [Pseudoalteromonas sp. G4]